MSEFLHCLAAVDQRFPVLLFTIRAWCKQLEGIREEGAGISNFVIAMLVVHFLQVTDPPVLPCVTDSGKVSPLIICVMQYIQLY